MKKIYFLILIILVLLVFPGSMIIPQTSNKIDLFKVTKNVYEVRGGMGANCAFFIGQNEVFVIDGKMSSQSTKDMISAIKTITEKPITHLLLTHSDGDHVNGLNGFSDDLWIAAHKNTKKHIEIANKEKEEKLLLPNIIFTDKKKFLSGSDIISLLHFGPAHTDGDVVIYIPSEKVAIVGDLYFEKMEPLIHKHKNGDSTGLLSSLKEILKLDADVFLSGHSQPVNREKIMKSVKYIENRKLKISKMIKEGKTLEEIKTIFGISLEKKRRPSLCEIIYLEETNILKKKD